MALLINDVVKVSDRGREPDIRVVFKDIVADAAYSAGGYAITPAQLGLTSIIAIVASPTVDGAHAVYDSAAGKIKFFVSGGSGAKLTEASGAGVSGSVARILVFGL